MPPPARTRYAVAVRERLLFSVTIRPLHASAGGVFRSFVVGIFAACRKLTFSVLTS